MSIGTRRERVSSCQTEGSRETSTEHRDEACPEITRHSCSSKHQRATEGCRQRAQKRGPPRHGPSSRAPRAVFQDQFGRFVAAREGCRAPRGLPTCGDLRGPTSYVVHSASCAPVQAVPHLIARRTHFAPSIERRRSEKIVSFGARARATHGASFGHSTRIRTIRLSELVRGTVLFGWFDPDGSSCDKAIEREDLIWKMYLREEENGNCSS